jgi:hypothetical protein
MAGRNKPGPAKGHGGRARVLRKCEWCGEPFGFREMRTHRPNCPKRGTLRSLVSDDVREGYQRELARVELHRIAERFPDLLQELEGHN